MPLPASPASAQQSPTPPWLTSCQLRSPSSSGPPGFWYSEPSGGVGCNWDHTLLSRSTPWPDTADSRDDSRSRRSQCGSPFSRHSTSDVPRMCCCNVLRSSSDSWARNASRSVGDRPWMMSAISCSSSRLPSSSNDPASSSSSWKLSTAFWLSRHRCGSSRGFLVG